MQLCFYLLLVLHVAEGCTLENNWQRTDITAYTGESVLLPCYCTDTNSKPETFTWEAGKYWKYWKLVSNESGQYRGRVQLFNSHSPGNLSLLISHLTEEDGGEYMCDAGSEFTFISLTVEGCRLENQGKIKEITAYTGESVLLPCYCTDTNSTPETFTWTKFSTWEEISTESDQYRDRLQLFNSHSPGNLSLLISHLTEEDGGVYKCDAGGSGFTYIRLTVKVVRCVVSLLYH
ncbi:polymeric immunoglobulin receptor-like [Hoplias malabaricus]|uniref:polymeric immunoglobulin receptor-like n=1 Tax=Hoplias malabaricus TaxID=27720 RepID=UPI00346273CF